MAQRNYRAEYQRRIERAKVKGYSKSVARGHAPRGVAGLRTAKFLGLEPGESLGLAPRDKRGRLKIVVEDARRTFGEKPVRERGDTPESYAEKLAELQERKGKFEWSNEPAFVAMMLKLGLTEREAYTHWFS